MVQGKITKKVTASSSENAKEIGAIFNNIVTKVPEKDLMSFYDKIHENPQFLTGIIKKLDNPLFKSFIN